MTPASKTPEKKMKSFRIYLPGGRVPTLAGLAVIGTAIVTVLAGILKIDFLHSRLGQVDPGKLKSIFVLLGLAIVGVGWLVLKILGIPFSKNEDA